MPKLKHFALKLSAVALLLLAGGWLALRLAYPPFIPPPLPQPNGYDDLLQAAEMLAPRTGFYGDMAPEELTAIVKHNQPALAIARESLKKDCAVPLDWSADETWVNNVHFQEINKPREVARAFAAGALLAHRNGDTQLAIDLGLGCVRMGRSVAQGGLVVDWMIGHAIYSLGLHILRDEVGQLPRSDCEALQNQLIALKTNFESASKVVERDRLFYHATHNVFDSFMIRHVQNRQLRLMQKNLEETDTVYSVTKKLLLTHLAIRQFRLDENRFPKSLDELVPSYLESVPQDPFTEGPLVYRPSGGDYLLYSIGKDRQDDGGIEDIAPGKGDLLLEPREASIDETAENR